MNLYDHAKLQEAFDIYVRERDARLPDEETLSSVTLSPTFHRRMKRLFARRKNGYFVLFGTVGRRVATIVVALLAAATIATAGVEALRESVWEFFTQIFEKYTQVTFADDAADDSESPVEEAFVARIPAYIPEGYKLAEEAESRTIYRMIYTNEADQRIVYVQQKRNAGVLIEDTEGVQYISIKVNGFDGLTYTNKEMTSIAFSDDEYIYRFYAPLDVEEIIQIAESLQEK